MKRILMSVMTILVLATSCEKEDFKPINDEQSISVCDDMYKELYKKYHTYRSLTLQYNNFQNSGYYDENTWNSGYEIYPALNTAQNDWMDYTVEMEQAGCGYCQYNEWLNNSFKCPE